MVFFVIVSVDKDGKNQKQLYKQKEWNKCLSDYNDMRDSGNYKRVDLQQVSTLVTYTAK